MKTLKITSGMLLIVLLASLNYSFAQDDSKKDKEKKDDDKKETTRIIIIKEIDGKVVKTDTIVGEGNFFYGKGNGHNFHFEMPDMDELADLDDLPPMPPDPYCFYIYDNKNISSREKEKVKDMRRKIQIELDRANDDMKRAHEEIKRIDKDDLQKQMDALKEELEQLKKDLQKQKSGNRK